jgi:type IV pilus assembly protein PilE
MTQARSNRGFTLVELMVVVAIVALLAVIAYPAYTSQMERSRRADAKIALQNVAQKLERCRSVYGAFNSANCDTWGDISGGDSLASDQIGGEGYYTVTGAATASTFTVTAAAAAGPQVSDDECASFSLNHLGVKSSKDDTDADSSDTCW